jgi:hypothetical protein
MGAVASLIYGPILGIQDYIISHLEIVTTTGYI